MIKYKFVNNETIHALLTCYKYHYILIPVRAIIKDIKFINETYAKYLIQIIKFYDDLDFLKEYLLKMPLPNKVFKKPRLLRVLPKNIKTMEDLEKIFAQENNFIYVDSVMCVKHEYEMIDLFNKIQNYLIEKNLRSCRDFMTRKFYTGKYKFNSMAEFNVRLKNFIGDKINMDFDEFIEKL